MFIHITLAGSKCSSGTLPTMHSIYVYTNVYQGLKIFANGCIYIYIYCGKGSTRKFTSSQSNLDKHAISSIYWGGISSCGYMLMIFCAQERFLKLKPSHNALDICIYWYISRAQFFLQTAGYFNFQKNQSLKVTVWLKSVLVAKYYSDVIMQMSSCAFQIFTGNTDQNTVQTNNMESLPRTKFIRFRPTAVHKWATLRVEIYGAAQGSAYSHILYFEFTSICWMLVLVELCIEGIGMDGQ